MAGNDRLQQVRAAKAVTTRRRPALNFDQAFRAFGQRDTWNVPRLSASLLPPVVFRELFKRVAAVTLAPMDSGHDPSASARAQAAFNSCMALYQGLIEAISHNLTLSADQKAVAIVALRVRQKYEATLARNLILEEERGAERRRQRERRAAAPTLER